jgi:hypothetical protein
MGHSLNSPDVEIATFVAKAVEILTFEGRIVRHENQRSIDPHQSGKRRFGRFARLALVAALSVNPISGIEGTHASPGPQNCDKPKPFEGTVRTQ